MLLSKYKGGLIKKMKRLSIFTITLLVSVFLLAEHFAQAQPPLFQAGVTSRPSSQLIIPFWDVDDVDTSAIQVTNTSETAPVAIHVQFLQSDGFDPLVVPGPGNVRCLDIDFTDELTPLDTHVYDMSDVVRNIGTDTGIDTGGFEGFAVITPIVSQQDRTAIAFQHLIGTAYIDLDENESDLLLLEGMGRDAINLATGAILPDSTILDGTSNGFVIVQPEEIIFDTALAEGLDESAIITIGINDNYLPGPSPGYVTEGGTYTLRYFFYDLAEAVNSCGILAINCYAHRNINDEFDEFGDKAVEPTQDSICGDLEFGEDQVSFPAPFRAPLQASFFVENLAANTSVFSYTAFSYGAVSGNLGTQAGGDGASWTQIAAEGFGTPPTECTQIPEECGNPVCKQLPGCENPGGVDPDGVNFCEDGVDNDGVDGTDCADIGCDGFLPDTSVMPTITQGIGIGPCEPTGETSCADGFDNDNNGEIDCGIGEIPADTNCIAIGACGDDDDDDDSGGCNLAAGSVATGTAAANFLLPLLPLAGAYALRRIRRRNIK